MTDKRKKAAAIRYESTKDNAPRVTAKGHGIIAENIIKKAKEYGVHIEEDPDLVEVLTKLEINEEIPENLYKAFAFILAELYQINNNR